MQSKAIETLVAGLRRGELGRAPTAEIAEAVRTLVAAKPAPSLKDVRAAAKALNGQTEYEQTITVAAAWPDDPTLQRLRAQALINLGSLEEAERVLEAGLKQCGAPNASADAKTELPEYEGLLGRLWKQRFVESGSSEALATSLAYYRSRYETPGRPYWHGINVVALLARQERAGGTAIGDSAKVAEQVHADVKALYERGDSERWLLATACEACLALGRCDEAELWLSRFLRHPKLQPFEPDSYSRQLREIWEADASGDHRSCANYLASILDRHLAQNQGLVSVSGRSLEKMKDVTQDESAYERNFGPHGTFSRETMRGLLDASDAVGCVCNAVGARLGTGFVLAGKTLSAKKPFAGPVFLTNAHVISDKVQDAIRPRDVRVMFEAESGKRRTPKFYQVDKVLFTSPPGELSYRCPNGEHLDVTIVTLKELPAKFPRLTLAGALPLVNAAAKAFVVGHPRGAGLQFALHDSQLLDIDDDQRLLHYRTPTDPGSSGSPVLNIDFEVMALHHAGSEKTPRFRGGGTHEANEGISLGAIRKKL